jgi:hypothetical protein
MTKKKVNKSGDVKEHRRLRENGKVKVYHSIPSTREQANTS